MVIRSTAPRYRAEHRSIYRAAFTLVEVVVVIGIIALLAGILTPTISRARDGARTVGCLANLRQIVAACNAYSAISGGYIIPAQYAGSNGSLDGDEAWCNILVNTGIATAPNSVGKGPQERSIFHCPNGGSDLADVSLYTVGDTVIPESRSDGRGAQCLRYLSASKKTAIDCWYGINATFEDQDDLMAGPPCRRIFPNRPSLLAHQDLIRNTAEMVYFYDGIYAHYQVVNANRINARHARQTQTNLAFFDGHAATYATAGLPGGMVAKPSDFSKANLDAKYPGFSHPMWLMSQQN
jgi:prepilin-type N-terminal cleavage/methylation domain-containing protein/prepilin-type processing-associated H-X9-DG protein